MFFMRNAKKELLEELDNDTTVLKCAIVEYMGSKIKLNLGHKKEDLEKFLELLNFEYDAGYGGQELHGILWLKDNTWVSRGEYDGSEWWEHNKLPKIPQELV